MKIIIRTHNSPERVYLVDLPDNELIERIMALVNDGQRTNAIKTALDKGTIIREIPQHEDIAYIRAKLILTQTTVHYDLM